MEKDCLIKLTNNLYRLTLLFPKKEPLRYKMRELADEILAALVVSLATGSLAEVGPLSDLKDRRELDSMILKLETIDCFFEVAKEQNWVTSIQLLEVQAEYTKIKEDLKRLEGQILAFSPDPHPAIQEEAKPEPAAEFLSNPVEERSIGLLARQQKILEILKEKGKAQVWEFKNIFPEVTKRTLRRNFEQLLKQGLIERMGERNETFYQIKEQA